MRRAALITALLLASIAAFSQTTKVMGRVLDAFTGEPVPFCGVYFKDSQTGVSTGDDGAFTLTTRDASKTCVCAHMLGYRPQEINIKPGVFSEILFFLTPEENRLSEVVVKADDSKARRLLKNIEANRRRNSPELRSDYECDVYTRMELDLSHPQEYLKGKFLKKNWAFVFDYIDTSEVSGVPYLPVAISESTGKRFHTVSPSVDRETLSSSRLSGADPSGSLLSQFTGSIHLKANFYKQYVNVFNVEIPSPTSSNGLLYYNYYIIDSMQVDGRNTYLVRYHPKPAISTPAFDGEMYVDTGTWALKSIRARMVRGQNMNWVRDLVMETSFERVGDSTWFYKSASLYADFSVVAAMDSTKLLSLIGRRNILYSNPRFEGVVSDDSRPITTMEEGYQSRDEAYWDSVRPYELTRKEKNIYKMVDKIQETDIYKTMYDVVSMLLNGYYDVGRVGFGHVLKFVSYNKLEGHRFRFGMHTSPDWSKTHRLTGFVAYGLKDRQFKGGASWEYLISKEPTRKLTLDAHYDVTQLGRGKGIFNDANFLSSIFGGGQSSKPIAIAEASALYEHEFNGNFNSAWQTMFRSYIPNVDLVPMRMVAGGQGVRNIYEASANAQLRFSRDETVIRGHFIKTYADTDFPVFTVGLFGGVSAVNPKNGRSNGWKGFFQPELSIDWKLRLPPAGVTDIHFNMGTIVGSVPYTMLHLHEGNGTFLLDKTSFSTMDFFEFASDSWASLLIEHDFRGFFLGKIPYVKKLQLREVFIFRGTWGYLSNRNDARVNPDTNGNGTRTLVNPDAAGIVYFPDGMKSMGKIPYIECGFGITNIFRLFRVDFVWRCTHRDEPRQNPRNFTVNFGIDLTF